MLHIHLSNCRNRTEIEDQIGYHAGVLPTPFLSSQGDWGGMDGTLRTIEGRPELIAYPQGVKSGPSVFPRTRWNKAHTKELCDHKQFVACYTTMGRLCDPGCGFVKAGWILVGKETHRKQLKLLWSNEKMKDRDNYMKWAWTQEKLGERESFYGPHASYPLDHSGPHTRKTGTLW